jgi:hypothetical protein
VVAASAAVTAAVMAAAVTAAPPAVVLAVMTGTPAVAERPGRAGVARLAAGGPALPVAVDQHQGTPRHEKAERDEEASDNDLAHGSCLQHQR